MIDLQILKKTANVNKLRYAVKQINSLFAKEEYFSTPVPIHFSIFIEKLITSFIKSPDVFTTNDFNQFFINTKSVIDTFIYGCTNNLYKGKNKTLCYQEILNSILNSNENIIIKF